MPGILFVVATPIGNLDDLSPRAVETLKQVDRIACEDTRHTRKLLERFGVSTPTTSYHEHNEESKAPRLLQDLLAGSRLALVSDAGTPLLSDPGYRLVRLCREYRIPVIPVPGPSAAIAALSVSGLPTDRFCCVGFLPRRPSALRQTLQDLASLPLTLIFYLSPHRLGPTLELMLEVLGNRQAFLARELTKLHETFCYAPLAEIVQRTAREKPQGEYTLVLQGADPQARQLPELDVAAYVQGLVSLRGLPRPRAVRQAAQDLHLPRNEVYARVLEAQQDQE